MKLSYTSSVKDGKLQVGISNEIANDLKQYEGKRVVVTLERLKSKRSLEQNAYIHVMFTIFKDELNKLGNDFRTIEVKEMLKAKFALIDVINTATGECIGQRIKGTSEMTKTELSEFIDKVITYGADMFGFQIPYPTEKIMLNFND